MLMQKRPLFVIGALVNSFNAYFDVLCLCILNQVKTYHFKVVMLFHSLDLNIFFCYTNGFKAWRTLLVYTAKNLTSFGSYELIKTQIASIFGKKLKFIYSFSLNFFFLAVRPK